MSESINATPVTETIETPATTNSSNTETNNIVKDEAVLSEQELTPVKPQSTLKKYKLKIDNKEEDFDFDPSNEAELTKHLQLSKVAQKRMNEKAQLEKGLAEFVKVLKSDPRKVLTHPDIGVDLKEFAKAIIADQLAEEAKSPEQREKEALLARVQKMEEEKKRDTEAAQAREFKMLQDSEENRITGEIKSAISTVGLPYSERAIKHMADYMSIALKENVPLTAQDVAPLVKQKMIQEYKEMLMSSPDELLEEFIDKDINTRLQKRRMSKAKLPAPSASAVKNTGEKAKEKQPVKSQTIRDFFGV